MEPLKNLFSPSIVRWVAHHLKRQLPTVDVEGFQAPILARLDALELKERAQLLADHLFAALPQDVRKRHDVLRAMLHPDELDRAGESPDEHGLCGWSVMPLTLVVGQHGLEDFDGALDLLKAMTKRLTSEFAIRYLLVRDQERAIRVMTGWLDDPNRHVRRLVSEGTRPRLPWAMQLPKLIADPAPTLPLLRALRDDPEPYVRRSVANHLNDISKDHPTLLAEIVEDWMVGASDDRRALLKHACRSLIKKGDPRILAAFGRRPAMLAVGAIELSTVSVTMPGLLEFRTTLGSQSDMRQDLTIDYVVHYRKANGTLAPKVFKGGDIVLAPGEVRPFRRNHRFAEITTRKHYAGPHRIGLRINGADTETVEFDLIV